MDFCCLLGRFQTAFKLILLPPCRLATCFLKFMRMRGHEFFIFSRQAGKVAILCPLAPNHIRVNPCL